MVIFFFYMVFAIHACHVLLCIFSSLSDSVQDLTPSSAFNRRTPLDAMRLKRRLSPRRMTHLNRAWTEALTDQILKIFIQIFFFIFFFSFPSEARRRRRRVKVVGSPISETQRVARSEGIITIIPRWPANPLWARSRPHDADDPVKTVLPTSTLFIYHNCTWYLNQHWQTSWKIS